MRRKGFHLSFLTPVMTIVLTSVFVIAPAQAVRNRAAIGNSNVESSRKTGGITAGGGGSLCLQPDSRVNQGRPILLDLTNLELKIIDSDLATGRFNSSSRYIEPYSVGHQDPVFARASEILESWTKVGTQHSRDLAELVQYSLNSLVFLKFGCQFVDLKRHDRHGINSCEELRTAAVFYYGFVFIERTSWNMMGFKSKVGLLLHESLRQLELGIHLANGAEPTNQELQDFTSRIQQGPKDFFDDLRDSSFFKSFWNGDENQFWNTVSRTRLHLTNFRNHSNQRKADLHKIDFAITEFDSSKLSAGFNRELLSVLDSFHDKTKQCGKDENF